MSDSNETKPDSAAPRGRSDGWQRRSDSNATKPDRAAPVPENEATNESTHEFSLGVLAFILSAVGGGILASASLFIVSLLPDGIISAIFVYASPTLACAVPLFTFTWLMRAKRTRAMKGFGIAFIVFCVAFPLLLLAACFYILSNSPSSSW